MINEVSCVWHAAASPGAASITVLHPLLLLRCHVCPINASGGLGNEGPTQLCHQRCNVGWHARLRQQLRSPHNLAT